MEGSSGTLGRRAEKSRLEEVEGSGKCGSGGGGDKWRLVAVAVVTCTGVKERGSSKAEREFDEVALDGQFYWHR